jgi:OmpA-OmpF porin, OOP family
MHAGNVAACCSFDTAIAAVLRVPPYVRRILMSLRSSVTSVTLSRSTRTLRGVLMAGVACGVLTAAAGTAQAQPEDPTRVGPNNGDGMDLHLFRPAIDSKGFFAVNGADILGKNDFSLGLVLDYARNLMPLNDGHGSEVMMENAFKGTLQFDFGIANLLVVGLSAPVILHDADAATGIGPTGETHDDDELDAQALGHIALHAKIRILRPDADPIGLAVIAQGGFGTGGSLDFGSEPGFFYWPQVVVEKRFSDTGAFRVALNVGYRGHTGQNPKFGTDAAGVPQLESGVFEYSNLLTGGLGLSLRVINPLDLIVETNATQQLGGDSDGEQQLSAEAMGGLKIFIERNSFLMLGAGLGYTKGFQAAEQRYTLGFIFEPSIGDRDGDGIKDDEDDCPDEPEDFDGFQDTRTDSPPDKYGCPDPDNDNDGILDVDDRCRDNPEDRDGDQDTDGCPEGSDGDRDGDGILDSRDRCPDIPEDRDGFEDKDGCPDPDNDKDGILDTTDQCKNDPEDIDQFEDTDGCPDPDNDKDGIPDVVEGSDSEGSCINRPETFNGTSDEDGCPDKGSVIVQDNTVIILEKINFKTASAEILPESNRILDEVSATLIKHPEFVMVEVQGHADERADDNYNLRLTQQRAKAVVEALVQRKVDAKTVRAMGYGEYCPLDPEKNAAAYDKNRRVEFKVVRTKDGPTGVDLGCPKAVEKKVIPLPP